MFCKKCGSEVRPGEKFCAKCGTAVSQQISGQADVRQEHRAGGKGSSIVIAVLAVIILAAVSGIGFTVYYMNSDGSGSPDGAAIAADTQPDSQIQADAGTQADAQHQPDTQADSVQAVQGSDGQPEGKDGVQAEQQEAEIKKALAAYEASIEEMLEERCAYDIEQTWIEEVKKELEYSMMYVDGDDIPECYVRGIGLAASDLFRYQDGKVLRYGFGTFAKPWYQKRQNKVAVDNIMSVNFQRAYYGLEDREDGLEELLYYIHGGPSGEEDVYLIGDSTKEIGEEAWYEDYFSSAGIFLEVPEGQPTMQQAYDALQKAEEETDAVDDRFGIIGNREEAYENPMLQNRYAGGYYFYDSGIGDFAFSYPHVLFCDVQYNEKKTKHAYGTNLQDICFTGSGGSELKFTLIKRDGKESLDKLAGSIYAQEAAGITDAVKLGQDAGADYSKFVVTGYDSGRDHIIYEVVKIDADYVMMMEFTCPQYTDEQDRLYKGYVTECIYRLCKFTKKDSWARSFAEYEKAQHKAG